MKLDKSYKVKVNPEQSREIHDLLGLGCPVIADYLTVNISGFVCVTNSDRLFEKSDFTEITAPELIALLSQKETKMPNLSDFLKCKKVRCVEALYPMKVGEIYKVEDLKLSIGINNKNGGFSRYYSNAFEPVLETAIQASNALDDTPMGTRTVNEFEVGDRVYTGLTRKIQTVKYFDIRENELITNSDEVFNAFKCCHATPENYEMLCKLYPHIEFEKPPISEPTQREQIIQAVNTLVAICHGASKSAGWWTDLATGEPLKRNKGEMLMLMVSELAEAMEADRKSLNDDHLPQYDGVSVELADCMVRICDFVGGFGLRTAEAMADKIEYNANRADHKIENRLKDNGKKY